MFINVVVRDGDGFKDIASLPVFFDIVVKFNFSALSPPAICIARLESVLVDKPRAIVFGVCFVVEACTARVVASSTLVRWGVVMVAFFAVFCSEVFTTSICIEVG